MRSELQLTVVTKLPPRDFESSYNDREALSGSFLELMSCGVTQQKTPLGRFFELSSQITALTSRCDDRRSCYNRAGLLLGVHARITLKAASRNLCTVDFAPGKFSHQDLGLLERKKVLDE